MYKEFVGILCFLFSACLLQAQDAKERAKYQ